jgi:hypothetical protein
MFIVQTSAMRPDSSKRRQTMRLPSGVKPVRRQPGTFVSRFWPEPSARIR